MIRTIDLNLTREKPRLEFHCLKDRQLCRFVVTRTDRPSNHQWHFRSMADAIAFARKHTGEAGALFCEVDAYGCAEQVTRLDPQPATGPNEAKKCLK